MRVMRVMGMDDVCVLVVCVICVQMCGVRVCVLACRYM